MCGIVGYTGGHDASPILLAGLRRLEYRGYDSAGLATLDGSAMVVRKKAGRVRTLEENVEARAGSAIRDGRPTDRPPTPTPTPTSAALVPTRSRSSTTA
jgi:glucosamine 6-phosphate synthetase-like amidotransferase/phosphosugar isomerase protein